MIVDDITIEVWSGAGGDGAATFRREKYIPRGGPDGGNGGRGGSVILKAIQDLMYLKVYKTKPIIKAEKGENGRGRKQYGADSPDLFLYVPVGTQVTDIETNETWDVSSLDFEEVIIKGGRGGRGNYEFRSSTNQTPLKAEAGRYGKKRILHFNLQYIADVGLIGLPNAGKSSLMNVLTQAHAKVGDYPFTTLEPNLGVMDRLIIADIPGLIEGAHEGKGLGIRFLKHINKTKLLVHCIDPQVDDVKKSYEIIRKELHEYDPSLLDKPELIVLTKNDLISPDMMKKQLTKVSKYGKAIAISVLDDESINEFKKVIHSLIKNDGNSVVV